MANPRPATERPFVVARRQNENFPAVEVQGYHGIGIYLNNGAFRGKNSLSDRYELTWVPSQHGKPGLNTLLSSSPTIANYILTDPSFEILGTNAVSADCAINTGGGIKLSSHGADGDSTILAPHLLAGVSPWTGTLWPTDNAVHWACRIRTGPSVVNYVAWAGLKLTNTPTATTDNDQVFVRVEDDVSSGHLIVWASIGNVDVSVDTGLVVAANTDYFITVEIDLNRIANVFINGRHYLTTAALTTGVNLIPYIGVKADGAAAVKSLIVYGQQIRRTVG